MPGQKLSANSSPRIPAQSHCGRNPLRPRVQPALHYELEQISKTEILRKLKQRFGGKTIRDVRFRLG
jgi:hypothetical protein